MRALKVCLAAVQAARGLFRRSLFTAGELAALADRPRLEPFAGSFVAQLYQNRARDEVKTTDVWRINGDPVVVETWLITYPDGQTDTLQRRHPVTDPHERAALLERSE